MTTERRPEDETEVPPPTDDDDVKKLEDPEPAGPPGPERDDA